MSKQTAVEWLIEQWPILESQLPPWLIDQAKAMEREQIIDAHKQGEEFALVMNMPDSKEYYDITYKGGSNE